MKETVADPTRAGWHTQGVAETLATLDTRPGGLSAAEAAARLAAHGPNELVAKRKRTPLAMFLDQFKDFMIVVLIASAVLAGALGEAADTIAIVVIVVLNATLGFTQEYRAERAMEALKKMAASLATVVRDGAPAAIPAAQLVPGDIVHLEAGNVVPADLRLIEAARLKIEEAALTGESVPSEKRTDVLADAGLPIGDRRNLAYKGTVVTYGRGAGVVVATGMRTELGRIATLLQGEEEGKTPLQKRLVAAAGKRRVGDRVRVLVDGPSPEHPLVLRGRTAGQAPEIDSVVYLSEADPEVCRPGTLLDAEVVGARGYDLVARPLSPAAESGGLQRGLAEALRAKAGPLLVTKAP